MALPSAMYIVPRAAPERLGMPILGYFLVVGSVLTAMLFAADAYMPRTEKLTFASNFDGLPASYKGDPASRRSAAAPHIASTAPVAETTGFALASEPRQQTAAVAPEAAKPAKPERKIVHKRQRQDDDDWFGGSNRRDFAFGSRDSFGSSSREREPSWRDTWASGAFEQPRETRSSRRSASRTNNDFWSFR